MTPLQNETRLLSKKAGAYCGIAKIRLTNIRYKTNTLHNTHTINILNITKLQKIFNLQNCLCLNPNNYIPILIFQNILNAVLRALNLLSKQLKGHKSPILAFKADSLLCLHRKHRLEAAKRYFEYIKFEDT